MTDTPDPWKEALSKLHMGLRVMLPKDVYFEARRHVDTFVDAARASSDAQTRLRLDALTGERAADEERLRQAGARVGIWYGCDTPDWLAEEILGLRARLDALEAEKKALADEYLEREYARAEGRRMSSGYYPHLGICSAAHWKPLGEPGCICDRQFKRERNRAEKAEAQLTLAESSRASLEAEQAWQPIDTAEKSLEPVLLWVGDRVMKGRWIEAEASLDGWPGYPARWEDCGEGFELKPTHWKPLPLPPSSPSAQETPEKS